MSMMNTVAPAKASIEVLELGVAYPVDSPRAIQYVMIDVVPIAVSGRIAMAVAAAKNRTIRNPIADGTFVPWSVTTS